MADDRPGTGTAPGLEQVSDEDFAQILGATRDFVRTRVIPRENEIMELDAIPDDLRQAAAEMGLFGYAIPQEWGGLGLSLTQDVELAMELGYTSLSLRSMFGTNNGIAGQTLVNYGTDEQRKRWLPAIASGEVVASFALTEPGAGSSPAGLKTRAVADGDDWVIDGSKRFITNAPTAGLFVVFARTREAAGKDPGIAVFLVPADAPGITVGPHDRKMGQEGAWTADVTFSGVRVPRGALVGGSEEVGYRAAMSSLARGRVHIAALAVGAARRALDESVAYAASASAASSSSRRTSPTCRPAWRPGRRSSASAPASTTPGRTAGSRRRSPSCSAPRWRARSPTGQFRCTAAPGTCARCRSSGSTATSGCCGCTRARARSSASSSAAAW
jgi:acyl-CoA dehydrogenase